MAKKGQNGPGYYARLSGIGMQMAVTIFAGALIGRWIDGKYPNEKNIFTIIFTLVFVAASLYIALKQINNLNEN